ncbi:Hypp4158 [Branchiostoma lanceolatum]|uniref:Hypp4158 protein n=1 Tax=Branchiostoma lanceolatum TaxID=7740 RepID=A0A8K0EWT3_BRALA|nr:Hypp4158 [Branchiostoma lanceolatum]
MSAVCNMMATPPLLWTHLVAFASGGAVFAVVFYFSGPLLLRVSPRFCNLDTNKRAEVRYHKDVSIVRHTSAFDLGYLLADVVISVGVAGPRTALTFAMALHHAIAALGELISLVYGFNPYIVTFHQRMDLTAPPTRFRCGYLA